MTDAPKTVRVRLLVGLDLEGKKMTVRAGVIDVIKSVDKGQMIFAYSGGLHHVQIPGEGFPKLLKTLKMDLETFEISEYKAMFNQEETGSRAWRKSVLDDIQNRLETKPPTF